MAKQSALNTEVQSGKPKKQNSSTESLGPMGVRLPPEVRADMEAICDRDGVPMATFIREAVQERMLVKKPELARRGLFRALTIAAAQFEAALKLGVLAGTEAEKGADGIRQFFGEFVELVKDAPVQLSDQPEEEQ